LSEPGKGYTFAMLSALLSGINYVLGKWVMADLSPELLVALIFGLAALIQGGLMAARGDWKGIRRCTARGWLWVLFFSLFSVVALWTLWTGIKYLDPTVASFISRLQTLVTVFLGIALLKDRFHRWEAVGGVVVILGVAVIYASFDLRLSLWFWIMVASGISFGVTEVVAKVALRYLEATPLSFIRTLFVAVFFLVWVMLDGQPLLHLGRTWWGVVAIAVMGPTLARLFYLYALERLDVSKAALVNQVQPLFVFLVAFLFLGTIPSVREFAGGLLILAGCVALISGRAGRMIRNGWGRAVNE